jgi:hypothetical protein
LATIQVPSDAAAKDIAAVSNYKMEEKMRAPTSVLTTLEDILSSFDRVTFSQIFEMDDHDERK